MNNRVTRDSGNSVSLFPFLAVLLCTMGALLVLLVVLAQRAGQRAVAEVAVSVVVPASLQKTVPADSSASDSSASDALVERLQKVQAFQQRLAKLREQADQRLLAEQQRLTHLEEHTRRLEHQLARLSLAAEQLQATEQNQSVDQGQADRELTRLQQLIKETEARLEALRAHSQGLRSYAIVPYRGPNGTYRKPIYIECRKDGIVLHPEGIPLQASDFVATSWAGNPLAAALRATRDHVNAQAAKAGAAQPPDPYPLILVRPDGIRQYNMARAAIKSWDAHYGYEFIDGDWQLSFPELPDPQLARVQQHAIMLARQRLARLIRSAPSRFGSMGLGGSATGGRASASGLGRAGPGGDSIASFDADSGGGAAGEVTSSGQLSSEGQLGQTESASPSSGNGFAPNPSAAEPTFTNAAGAARGDAPSGASAGDALTAGEAQPSGRFSEGGSETDQGESEFPGTGGTGGGDAQVAGSDGSDGSDAASAANSAAAGAAQTAAGHGRAGGAAASGGKRAAGSGRAASGQPSSIADSQGSNWAVQNDGRSAVAISRPIHMVVRQDQIVLLPSRHVIDGDAATSKVISLSQSMPEISSDFVAALRSRVDEWGLAGNGLYWRPVIKLNFDRDGEQTAKQVLRMLRDSGVEVSLPDTARVSGSGNLEGTSDAKR